MEDHDTVPRTDRERMLVKAAKKDQAIMWIMGIAVIVVGKFVFGY